MATDATKADYKATLCLPQTGFAMRANLNQREPEILKKWAADGLAAKIAAKPSPRGKFILHDGPPYANGHIHLGHALNKILKDLVVRVATMSGYSSPYVPGWDCHGLPIEQKVGQEIGSKKAGKTALELRHLCEDYARKWVKVQSEEFQRLGIGGAWDRPYLTMDREVEVGILSALRDLVVAGYVYKGLKPVFWCATCQTALADAEVEYENHTSNSIYVKFPIIDPEKNVATAGLKHPSIIIWTTTPWTLPANMAVSLHPDFKYVALRTKAQKNGMEREEDYIIAKELVPMFTAAAEIKSAEILREVAPNDLENMLLEHPVQPDRTSRVILGTHVTLEQGTGAVHTAPGHGMDDFIVSQKYGIDTVVPVDAQGRFTNEFSFMEGMKVWEANEPIIRYLDEKDLLVSSGKIEHSYPHCWRCHNPIIYRATEQWFANVDHDGLRGKCLKQIDDGIEWIPRWGHDRIYNMMSARPDWCLSRQRAWGVPIPAVVCKKCNHAELSPAVLDKFTGVVAQRGTNSWFEDPAENFLPEGFACPKCGAHEFEKEFNILDVWFDSGSTHIGVLETRPELSWPADMYLEGADQHRGWFMSSFLIGMSTRGAPPFRSVLTHGFALDGKGEAMSKSRGNVIAPEDIIKKQGADVLRLWVASVDYRSDVRVSQEILDRVGEAYRRIRNTIRYLLGNLGDFDPVADRVEYKELPEIDRWLLHELGRITRDILKAFADYEYHKIYHFAHEFCVVQLSSIYVDVLKDRVYCSGAKSPLRRAAQTTQYEVAQALIRLLAPVLVFTCDDAYQFLDTSGTSVHVLPFPEPHPEWDQPELARDWAQLLAVRSDVLKALEDARQVKKAIGQSLEAAVLVAPKTPDLEKLLRGREEQLAELFITSQARVCASAQDLKKSEVISELGGEQVEVVVLPAEGSKCERCWRILPSVGSDAEHPGICSRCADVVRRYY